VPKPGAKDLTPFYNQGHNDGLIDGSNDVLAGSTFSAEPGRGGRTLPTDPSENASYVTGYNIGYAEGYGAGVKPFSTDSVDTGMGKLTPDISKGTGAPKPTADYATAAFNAGYASGKIDGYQDGKAGKSPSPHADPPATESAFYKDNYLKGYNNAYGMFYEGGKKDTVIAPSSVDTAAADPAAQEAYAKEAETAAADAIASAFSSGVRRGHVGQGLARHSMGRSAPGGQMLGGRGSQTYLPDYWWTSMPKVTPAHLGMWAPPTRTGYTIRGANVWGVTDYSHRPVLHPYRG
jgi:hypothetical protein